MRFWRWTSRHIAYTTSCSASFEFDCRVYANDGARRPTVLPFLPFYTLVLCLWPVISLLNNTYFPVPFIRCTPAPWITRRGDISWNYDDSSRRCICHGCNMGLILLRLLDVTISFATSPVARSISSNRHWITPRKFAVLSARGIQTTVKPVSPSWLSRKIGNDVTCATLIIWKFS